MICWSTNLEGVLKNPDFDCQLSCYDPHDPVEDYFTYITKHSFPKNVKVVHAPIKLNVKDIPTFLGVAVRHCNAVNGKIVFHPNRPILNYFDNDFIGTPETRALFCFENFPASNRKPLRTPLDILEWTKERGFGICFDYAHVEPETEQIWRSPAFLKDYLRYVDVVHFSGNRHTLMTAEDWTAWDDIIFNAPKAATNPQFYVLEHKSKEDKIKDGDLLMKKFIKLSQRVGNKV